jgi:DNA polymerase delta subunit 2
MSDGLEFMGTSGQSLHDMQLYSKFEDPSPIGRLRLLMNMQHLAPTAPDTLRSFPFREGDPFVVEQAPHVFFAGCQPSYGEELIY